MSIETLKQVDADGSLYIRKMKFLNIFKSKPYPIGEKHIYIFDRKLQLRILKGKVIDQEVKRWTRYYDSKGNGIRLGDGMDDLIVKEEPYASVEMRMKLMYYDGNRDPKTSRYTSLYFEGENLLPGFNVNDEVTYYGFWVNQGSWTNYFVYNHTNRIIHKHYYLKTVNERLFDNKFSYIELQNELDLSIKDILDHFES